MAGFAIPLAISGISSLAGWLSNKGQKQTQNQQQTNTSNIDNYSMPVYDEKAAILRDKLINMFLSRAEETPDFMDSYRAGGLNEIGRGADLQETLINNFLSSRGLNRSPVGGAAMAQSGLNRRNQQISFLNNLPMIQEQLTRDRMNDVGRLFSSLLTGQHNYGTTNSQSNGTSTLITPGNPWGGMTSSLATTLAGLYGRGAFGGGGSNSNAGFNPYGSQ